MQCSQFAAVGSGSGALCIGRSETVEAVNPSDEHVRPVMPTCSSAEAGCRMIVVILTFDLLGMADVSAAVVAAVDGVCI